MKTYLLFQGDHYYPNGGYWDFVDKFNTLEDAMKTLNVNKDWYQVTYNHEIVESGVILRDYDALDLKRLNAELVIGKPCKSGHGNTELIAWFVKNNHQIAILKSLPYENIHQSKQENQC